jgi:hypothetical protein
MEGILGAMVVGVILFTVIIVGTVFVYYLGELVKWIFTKRLKEFIALIVLIIVFLALWGVI